MSDQLHSSDQSKKAEDLSPSMEAFGCEYTLSRRERRVLILIDAVTCIIVLAGAFAVIMRDSDLWGMGKWAVVTLAALILRAVLIKTMLVLFGAKGVVVPLSERKRRYARKLDAQGLIQTLWCLPVCFALLIALVTGDVVTGTKHLTKDLWLDAALIVSFVATLWLTLTIQRFIRKWRQQ